MFRRCLALSTLLVVLAVVALVAGAPQTGQKPQQPPAFRSGIVVVPIDVRVVDNKTGKPVTDLKKEDFTLQEEGVVQSIQYFEKQSLAPLAEAVKGERPPMRESPLGIQPQNNRIFLIVFGRGRLQEPSKAVDAMLHFVRNQLLPQDQVAVFAYDRATDFTNDHEKIAKLIERFRAMHFEIDMEVGLQVTNGIAAVYGSKSIPRSLQSKVDKMFQGEGDLAFQEIGRGQNAATRRADADSRTQVEALQRADQKQAVDKMNEGTGIPGMPWTTMDEISASMFTDMGLDEFMAYNAQTLMDLGNCYAGIEYLRHLEGEKHLVFVTEKGMYLPRLNDDTDLAAAANDARVSIDTFQTGGIEGQRGGAPQNNMSETFAFKSLRTIAELTGGVSAIGEPGMQVVDRLNQTTLNDYVLGYYPSLANFDGKYRKITVKVNRPDVTVLYRHGYYARREIGGFDRRSFITRDRIAAAASFNREIKDIKLKFDAALKKVGDVHQVTAKVIIDPTNLSWVIKDGKHVGSIDIAMTFANEKGQMLGQHYQRADVNIAEENWQSVVKNGIPYQVTVDMNAGVRMVRVIIYDYRADLVGTADRRVW